jgi:flagellar biosynthesis protein FliP
MALTTRVRFALSQDNYTAQPFDQDGWMKAEARTDAQTALDAYLALRRLDVAMFTALTTVDRQRSFNHPEYGVLSPEWVMAQLAGHDLHHMDQLRRIAS